MLKSNLEPIEEKDLDLEGKLKKGLGGNFSAPEAPTFGVEREAPTEISSAEKDSAYGKILAKVQTQTDNTTDQTDVSQDAQVVSQKTNAQSQVSHLVDLASQKGVVHAVKVARHLEDNYVLDTFHDKLLGQELHDALVAKGMIKEL